jgi:hypothetical protein
MTDKPTLRASTEGLPKELAPCPKCGQPSRLAAIHGNCLGCTMEPTAHEKLVVEARKWVAGHADHECGAYIDTPCIICDPMIERLTGIFERHIHESVAERDREWTTTLGVSLNHRGEGVTPEWMRESIAGHNREMAKAVAEERKALREILGYVDPREGPSRGTLLKLLAALDAREKRGQA